MTQTKILIFEDIIVVTLAAGLVIVMETYSSPLPSRYFSGEDDGEVVIAATYVIDQHLISTNEAFPLLCSFLSPLTGHELCEALSSAHPGT